MSATDDLIAAIRGRLVVSCQASPGEAMFGPAHMADFARAAQAGGAAAIRANGSADVVAVRRATGLPVIAIEKRWSPDTPCYITPTVADGRRLVAAGAAAVATDGTGARRPDGEDLAAFVAALHQLGVPVMADVATAEQGLAAAAAGCDLLATTLAGYTPDRPRTVGPDLELVAALAAACPVPVVAEGRIASPADARAALAAGAWAVVVGTAITRPHKVTAAFVAALQA